MLYESISNSLNRSINRMLNEKKQQISPEDERDNELLRSVLDKISVGTQTLGEITDEERDAIKRNGFKIRDDDLIPAYGSVSSYGVTNPHHQTINKNQRVEPQWGFKMDNSGRLTRYISKPANVNIVDIGRKRQERINRYGGKPGYDMLKPMVYRGYKKTITDDYFPDKTVENKQNFENQLRTRYNDKLHTPYRQLQSLLSRRDLAELDSEQAFEDETRDRERIMNKIAELKKELRDLESKRNNRIDINNAEIDYLNDLIKSSNNRTRETINAKRQARENGR